VHQAIAGALYVAVAVMWLIPDRRIERMVSEGRARDGAAPVPPAAPSDA